MSDGIEEVVGGIFGFAVFAAFAIGLIVIIGMFVLPAVAIGGGALYYVRNVHLPAKHKREQDDILDRLYREAKRIAPPKDDLMRKLDERGITDSALLNVATELYEAEGLDLPTRPPVIGDAITAARYQEDLQRFISNTRPDQYRKFADGLTNILSRYQSSDDGRGLFHSRRPRTKDEIEDLILSFFNNEGICKTLTDQLDQNYRDEKEVMPSQSKQDNYAWAYLKGTPLLALEYVEESISLENRMYHTYLLGSSGSGKTSLIENIIANDLTSDEQSCVVVIDSQTQLTEKLAALDIPDTLYITPKWNLALNLFDVGYENMRRQGIEGETLTNKTVGLLSFVMEGMMGAAFTPPQKTIFQYAIQLVISIKGGNIFTFMDVLTDDGHLKYADQIAQFDPNTQRFFEVDFGSGEYKRSREAIRRRLDGLLLNPTFRRLFSATENKINMYEELLNNRLILIDTNKPMLDDVGSAFFGRLFIAMIVRASHMRFQNGGHMPPVYLVVDEAHEYFDRSISDMLEQARKANIGLIVAHQSLSQTKGSREDGRSNITDPLMVNTATKIVWTTFREDAAKFAGSMQISPDQILNLPQYTFGMYSRNRGFTPIRGHPNALGSIRRRDDQGELQEYMEGFYGPSEAPPEDPTAEAQPRPEGRSSINGSARAAPSGEDKPDVDMI